jgi:hypothetical protein
VTGTPTLTLNDGGTATYDVGKGPANNLISTSANVEGDQIKVACDQR